MSRTAKNQKDFKVNSLSSWKKNDDYALLCSPYFQYPSTQSQIYNQALENNVCLMSWEHLIFLIKNNIKESVDLNLSIFWNYSSEYAKRCVVSENKKCFLGILDIAVSEVSKVVFKDFLFDQISLITDRGEKEKIFWKMEIESIKKLSKSEAIKALISSKKICKKVTQIDNYIRRLKID